MLFPLLILALLPAPDLAAVTLRLPSDYNRHDAPPDRPNIVRSTFVRSRNEEHNSLHTFPCVADRWEWVAMHGNI
jgi:hypothetical protein